jgi:hypothetical protein
MHIQQELNMTRLLLPLCVLCLPAVAGPTAFVERAPYASGAAVIEPADGGEYVNVPAAPDRRIRSRAMLAAAPERQTYLFFSSQEEAELLNYRNRMFAEQVRATVTAARKRHYARTGKLDWPKVVVHTDEICVPELASSDAADWREHLVCHRDGAQR